MKMGENIFSELEGNNWAKSASGIVASQVLSACLVESQFKRCSPSKRCVSGQWFCLAAISSKSTGSAAAVAATVPAGGGVVGTKKRHFSNQVNTKAVH
jgi:hypothetical protein